MSRPPLAFEPGPVTEELLRFLSSGGRVGVIIGPSTSGKTALLNEIAAATGGQVFKIANPLMAQLSLARIMVQADVTDDGGDDAVLLTNHLAACAGPDTPAILAIDDAHTLNDEALRWLASLATRPAGGPGVQVLLAGQPGLSAKLSAPGLEALRDPQRVVTVVLRGSERILASPDTLSFKLPAVWVPDPPPPLSRAGGSNSLALCVVDRAEAPVHSSWSAYARAAIVVLTVAGTVAMGVLLEHPERLLTVERGSPAVIETNVASIQPPVEASVPVIAGQASEETSTVRQPTEKTGDELRQDLRAFLHRRGRSALARDPVQFEALFQDYLQWKSAAPR